MMSFISITDLFYKKHWYQKENFDADSFLALEGLREAYS